MMKKPIYLDYHATTPTDPRVIETMIPLMWENFGNSSSASHQFGWYAAEVVEIARERVAALIGAAPGEIIFTSGATESNNLAIFGVSEAFRKQPTAAHVITSAIEHRSVLDPVLKLKQLGYAVSIVPTFASGMIQDKDEIESLITPETKLVSLIYGHNEIGTLNNLRPIADLLRPRGIVLHTDATQAVGKISTNVDDLGVDLLSLSAHKFYGPKGVGALYVRQAIQHTLCPLLLGGGQELGLRSGTLNVPGIAGLGKAAELALNEMRTEEERLYQLSHYFLSQVASIGGVSINGALTPRLPGSLNLRFSGIESTSLLADTQATLAFSVGSACQSTSRTPSHVLRELGLSQEEQQSSFRICFGRFTTQEEVDQTLAILAQAVSRLRR